MRRTAAFLLLTLLALSGMATAGCGSRIAASVQAVAEPAIPQGVTWTAVPGPGMPADDPSIQLAVDQTAAPLASALSLYNWKWLSSPAQAENADVIVRIRWNTSNPQYIREVVPVFRPGIGLGMGWGHGPWRRGPFYGGYGGYYAEPAIQTIYTRSLTVEALRSADLSPEVRAAVLHRPTTGMQNDPQTPAASSPAREDLSKPPYAPALSLDGSVPPPSGKPVLQGKEGPYAPPIPDSDTAGIPAEAILWRVEVSSGSSKSNTRKILPQLAAAAAQAVGKTIRTDVFVDSDMRVTYSIP